MSLYAVKHRGRKGELITFVDAGSPEAAARYSKIHASNIISVKRDVVTEIKDLMHAKKVALNVQSLIVQSIANSLGTGGTLKDAFHDILAEGIITDYDEESVKSAETSYDFFKALKFHPSIITAAKAGEEVDPASTLADGAKYLQRLAKDQKEFGGKITSGFIYIIVGCLFMIAAPLMMGSSLNTLVNENGMDLKLNMASHYLMGARVVIQDFWWVIFVAGFACWAMRETIFEFFKDIPGLKAFHKLSGINRAIDFMSTFSLLVQVGATTEDVTRMMFDTSKGRNRAIYDQMTHSVSRGSNLFSTIANPEWPISIRAGLKNYDDTSSEQREKMFKSIIESLYIEQTASIETVVSVSSRLGMVACLTAIMTMAIGFYLPMMSITSVLRG